MRSCFKSSLTATLAACLALVAPCWFAAAAAQTPGIQTAPTPVNTVRVAAVPPGGLAPDPVSIWTLQDENASISSAKLTDRYYVTGLRLGWTSGTESTPAFLAPVARTLWGDGQMRVSFNLTQQIYTPADASARVPPAGDRPYAGVLLGNFGLQQDTTTNRSTLTLGLGVVGPAALGEEVQNGFHDLIGQSHNNGWGTQLHNEPAVQITSGRVWRLDTGNLFGLETQALPEFEAGVGTVRVYALGGLTMRIGQGLDADYGVARVEPGLSGGDAFRPTRPFAWYAFAGLDGQAVAHDITLNGNVFQSSQSVKLVPFVGEVEGGVAIMAFGARLTYTQVVQTQEFRHQHGGPHQFGSLALSMRF
jgi:lipid A 3-O-deacylase